MPFRAGNVKSGIKRLVVDDKAKPFARMGRKAYRVSTRDSRVAEVSCDYSAPAFLFFSIEKGILFTHASNP